MMLIMMVMMKEENEEEEEEEGGGDYEKASFNGKAGLRHLITPRPENITSLINVIKNMFYSFN